MSKRGGLMTKTLFFVSLFAGLCWTDAGDAFEPWEAKATTRVNVRILPGPRAQLIAWLHEGQKVVIIDKKKKWYKIVFRSETKTYAQGWVHGRYMEGLSAKKKRASSALAKVRAEIALEELQEKPSLGAPMSEDILPNRMEPKSNKAFTPTENHVDRKPKNAVPRESLPKVKKDVRPLPEKNNAATGQRGQGLAAFRTKSSVPAATPMVKIQTPAVPQPKIIPPKMEVRTPPPPAVTPVVVNKEVYVQPSTSIPVVRKPLKQEPPVSHDGNGLIENRSIMALGKFVLRLLSVVLSCFAILFSYKAIKLAKISHNTAMQLQRDLQVWQRREYG